MTCEALQYEGQKPTSEQLQAAGAKAQGELWVFPDNSAGALNTEGVFRAMRGPDGQDLLNPDGLVLD